MHLQNADVTSVGFIAALPVSVRACVYVCAAACVVWNTGEGAHVSLH